MIKIKVARNNNRGFLKQLFEYRFSNLKFIYQEYGLYDRRKSVKQFLASIVKLSWLDWFGLFQIIDIKNIGDEDMYFSYNRFVKCQKPYIIYLENPSALVNYSWTRPKYSITKSRLRKCFEDVNLKAIVCMSKSCYDGLNKLYDVPNDLRIECIYPLVCEDDNFNLSDIERKCFSATVECLFVAHDFRIKGGRDVLSIFKLISDINKRCHLTIITPIHKLERSEKQMIAKLPNVTLIDFNLSNEEMKVIYARTAILINPTRWDSFNLVVLEATKYGCAVLGTSLYAINEMVDNGKNGYLYAPRYKWWNDDNTQNIYIEKHKSQTIDSEYIDELLVESITNQLLLLCDNRDKLYQMCVASYDKMTQGEFSQNQVVSKWNNLLADVCGEK